MTWKDIAIATLERVGMAAVKGFIAFVALYVIPMALLAPALRGLREVMVSGPSPEAIITYFTAIGVFFTVAAELAKNTILEHALSIGRGLAMMVFTIYATNAGVFSLLITSFGTPIEITIDVSRLIVVFIGIGLLDMARGVLKALNWACERADRES